MVLIGLFQLIVKTKVVFAVATRWRPESAGSTGQQESSCAKQQLLKCCALQLQHLHHCLARGNGVAAVPLWVKKVKQSGRGDGSERRQVTCCWHSPCEAALALLSDQNLHLSRHLERFSHLFILTHYPGQVGLKAVDVWQSRCIRLALVLFSVLALNIGTLQNISTSASFIVIMSLLPKAFQQIVPVSTFDALQIGKNPEFSTFPG